jgi:hypothetical protein
MSKAHRNQSLTFKKKKETREKRRHKVLILREAQRRYREVYGCPKIKNIDMKRKNLVFIKKEVELEMTLGKITLY